jgi:hypothetical protein
VGVHIFTTDIDATTDFATATDAAIVTAVEAALENTSANVLSGTATSQVTAAKTAAQGILAFYDGTNTVLMKYVESGEDADFGSELTVVGKLIGVNAADLTHDNFFA